MAERLLPGAVWKPISYRLDAPKFPAPPLGYIVHVPVSNGSLFNYFNGLTSPGRKFCTAWIAKDGTGEQYQSLDRQAWAQAAGNPTYWSFEVEGFPTEPMTDAQLDTLATWHRFLGVDDAIATAPGQKGIGTHSMGGAAWGGHSCPGTIRTAELPQILDRLKGDDFMSELSAQEQRDLYNRVMANDKASRVLNDQDGATINQNIGYIRDQIRGDLTKLSAQQIADSIPANLAQQVVDLLGARLNTTKGA